MRIIFLDIDGVLNTPNHLNQTGFIRNSTIQDHYKYYFKTKCLLNLATLVKTTDAKIVISSNLRRYKIMITLIIEVLRKHGLTDFVIGCTPILKTSNRAQEIDSYLKSLNIQPDAFIILDDLTMQLPEYLPFLVQTNPHVGPQPQRRQTRH